MSEKPRFTLESFKSTFPWRVLVMVDSPDGQIFRWTNEVDLEQVMDELDRGSERIVRDIRACHRRKTNAA